MLLQCMILCLWPRVYMKVRKHVCTHVCMSVCTRICGWSQHYFVSTPMCIHLQSQFLLVTCRNPKVAVPIADKQIPNGLSVIWCPKLDPSQTWTLLITQFPKQSAKVTVSKTESHTRLMTHNSQCYRLNSDSCMSSVVTLKLWALWVSQQQLQVAFSQHPSPHCPSKAPFLGAKNQATSLLYLGQLVIWATSTPCLRMPLRTTYPRVAMQCVEIIHFLPPSEPQVTSCCFKRIWRSLATLPPNHHSWIVPNAIPTGHASKNQADENNFIKSSLQSPSIAQSANDERDRLNPKSRRSRSTPRRSK